MRRTWNRGPRPTKPAAWRWRWSVTGGDLQRCDDELATIVDQRRNLGA